MIIEKPIFKTDVLVVGGGAAGSAAATAAALKGAKVIVLEKNKKIGGNGLGAGGFFAAESKLQERQMVDARKDDLFHTAMEYNHWKGDARLWRQYIENTSPTIDWLEGMGLKFTRLPLLTVKKSAPAVFHMVEDGPLRTGPAVVKTLKEEGEKLGVDYRTGEMAKEAIMDGDKVVGIRTEAGNEYLAKSVILSAGGFSGDEDRLDELSPDYKKGDMYKHLQGMRNPGTGIKIAVQAGAMADTDIAFEGAAPKYAGPDRCLMNIGDTPYPIWLDKFGERFADEFIVYDISCAVNAVHRLPDQFCWVVFDDSVLNYILYEAQPVACAMHVNPASKDEILDGIRKGIEYGDAVQADSLEMLAEETGMDLQTLMENIERYNNFCDQKRDMDFCKRDTYLKPIRKPPYFAFKGWADFTMTHGGIRINRRFEALRKDGTPVEGLYAAGVEVSGINSAGYQIEISGHSFGYAVVSGKLAGENAASHAGYTI